MAACIVLFTAFVLLSAYSLPPLFKADKQQETLSQAAIASLPSFVGMTFEEAEAQAKEMGCTVKKSDSFSEEVEAGYVISQEPGEGTEISDALALVLTVSVGPEPADDTTTDTTSTQPSDSNQPTDGGGEPAPAPEPEPAPPPAGQRPVASFSMSPSSGPSSGVFVSFNGSGSYDPHGGSIVSYSWSFGAAGASASYEFHSAVAPTDIAVTLTVTDDEGQSSSATKYVHLY